MEFPLHRPKCLRLKILPVNPYNSEILMLTRPEIHCFHRPGGEGGYPHQSSAQPDLAAGVIVQSHVVPKCVMSQDDLRRGIHLFNAERFFEAHEALEDAWREAPAEDKKFLQGLVQLAVALHHHSTGNLAGSRSVMARALRNVSSYPDGLHQLRTKEILDAFLPCQRCLDENRSLSGLPKLTMHG
jgi:hypothetical protein